MAARKRFEDPAIFKSPEYRAWANMKKRCNNPCPKDAPYYRNRGITICDEWKKSPEAFMAYMGPRPSPQHSIDRIDNNGNYEPGNVRWATREQNRRNNRFKNVIEYGGKEWRLRDLARAHGVRENKVYTRMKRGFTVEQALSVTRLKRRWSGKKR